jgi:hypothetical protein
MDEAAVGDAEADPLSESQEKRTKKERNNKVEIKILISGLKKLEALNQALSQATIATQRDLTPPPSVGATTNSSSQPLPTPPWRQENCFEVIFQEIKMPSENYLTFREWFTTKADHKETLSLEEARNIVLFVHLHLSDNPEVTRQYSIKLLKKNCPLSPPSFYQLARWSHEIRELEKHKKDLDIANSSESAAKWEAVKHCMQHGIFQNRKIVPMNGTCADCCPSCAKTRMEMQTTDANRPVPVVAGELVRSQSSKDTRPDPGAVGVGGVARERPVSGHSLRDQKVCPNCGKTFVSVTGSASAGDGLRQSSSQKVIGTNAPSSPTAAAATSTAINIVPTAIGTAERKSSTSLRAELSAEGDKGASQESEQEVGPTEGGGGRDSSCT